MAWYRSRRSETSPAAVATAAGEGPVGPASPGRRRLLAALAAGSLLTGLQRLRATQGPRVIVLDWGLAATTLALGVTPMAIPDTRSYGQWISWPRLPPEVRDVGLRLQPNLELLWQLRPDLIVIIDEHAGIRPQLKAVAPTLTLPVYTPDDEPLDRAFQVTRRLGEALARPGASEALIERAEETFAQAREQLAGVNLPPLYLADILDAGSVRLFGERSLFGNVLRRLGVDNAWRQATSYWGSATVGPDRLAAVPEAGLVRVTPLAGDVRRTLADSPLWARLPCVRAGRTAALEPVLPFGALPSAMHFARQLGAALRQGFAATEERAW